MYLVTKPRGHFSNVTVANTDTNSSIVIGRLDMSIIRRLETAGHKIGDDGVSSTDEWNLAVDEETAKDLCKRAMVMKKPIRDQSKKAEIKKHNGKEPVDVFDLIFGI